MVFSAAGVTHHEQAGDDTILLRCVPSAGALYPLELYVICERVDGIDPGLYHYNVRDEVLERLQGGRSSRFRQTLVMPDSAADYAVGLIFTGVFRRSVRKYGARGYRFVLMEAGIAAEHVALQATELDLGSVLIGGFFDGSMNAFLGVEGIEEAALCAVLCGHLGT